MSTKSLIDILEKLLKLHKSLYQLEVEKTEVIKSNNIQALQILMKNEQKHITAIQMVEKERMTAISKLLPNQLDPTFTQCIQVLEPLSKEKVIDTQQQLKIILGKLKDANSLNQALLEQSLQFITLNLDLLLPNDVSNYKKGNAEEESLPDISLFDSKA